MTIFPPGDWRHARCDGYQDFRSVSAVSSHDDFVQVEPRQSAQNPLIGVNIPVALATLGTTLRLSAFINSSAQEIGVT